MKNGYVCEYCGSFHALAEKAIQCEATHTPLSEARIVSALWGQPQISGIGNPYPEAMKVRFGDWTCNYSIGSADFRKGDTVQGPAGGKPKTGVGPESDLGVYAIQGQGKYGGGLAIVAAHSKNQAVMVASYISDPTWHTRYGDPESIQKLPCHHTGIPGVLAHFETGE